MATRTENFGLVALEPGDSMDAEGYGFMRDNIEKIDQLLAKTVTHDHASTGASISDPTLAPTLVLTSGVDGALPAGTTIRYRYTWVDQYGSESAASPEATVATPAVIQAPGAPSAGYSITGGSLLGGLYNYGVSAYVDTNTNETELGGKVAVSVSFNSSANVINLTMPSLDPGASGFNIYRRAPNEANWSYLASTTSSTYDDDGSVTPNYSRLPQNRNLTNRTNKVNIELPESLPANATWKIYRSFTSGNWNASDLYHVLDETFVGSGVIVEDFDDYGFGTGLKSAPEVSQIGIAPGKISNNEVDFAFTPYSPSITGWTLGNGTLDCSYCQLGKFVHVRFSLTAGSTSTFAAAFAASLPVTAADALGRPGLVGTLVDASTGAARPAAVFLTSTTTFTVRTMSSITAYNVNGIQVSDPHPWAVSDQVIAEFVYEAA